MKDVTVGAALSIIALGLLLILAGSAIIETRQHRTRCRELYAMARTAHDSLTVAIGGPNCYQVSK